MQINSQEYWEHRFKTDWAENHGSGQSRYFAELLVELLPPTVRQEIAAKQLSILDLGCAEGDGTAYFQELFPTSAVTGVDFSAQAIRNAQEHFPACTYQTGSIEEWQTPYDMVICSNTLEHFAEPRQIFEHLFTLARHSVVLLLPFLDDTGVPEHQFRFDFSFFPLQHAGFVLSHCAVRASDQEYWPGQQILVIYTRDGIGANLGQALRELPLPYLLRTGFDFSGAGDLQELTPELLASTDTSADWESKRRLAQLFHSQIQCQYLRHEQNNLQWENKCLQREAAETKIQLRLQTEETQALQLQLTEAQAQIAAQQQASARSDEQRKELSQRLEQQQQEHKNLVEQLTELETQLREQQQQCRQLMQQLSDARQEANDRRQEANDRLQEANDCRREANDRLQEANDCRREANDRLQEANDCRRELEACTAQLQKAQEETDELRRKLEERLAGMHTALQDKTAQNKSLRQNLEELSAGLRKLQQQRRHDRESIARMTDYIQLLNDTLYSSYRRGLEMAEFKKFKALHLLNRVKTQLIQGERGGRGAFFQWWHDRKVRGTDDHSFNPLFELVERLNVPLCHYPRQNPTSWGQRFDQLATEHPQSEFVHHYQAKRQATRTAIDSPRSAAAEKIAAVLQSHPDAEVIVYPHIVHWEPLQTPQHLLRGLAAKGYICFFAEADFVEADCREIEPNIYLVHDSDLVQAVRNHPVTVLCTWMVSMAWAESLKQAKLWYHILDQLDIFSFYDECYLEIHREVVECADTVSYVAQDLKSCVGSRTDALYLPNAVRLEDFQEALRPDFIPEDMKPICATGHKIIGYYGYIAHWFDFKTLEFLAACHPEWEFVLIGKALVDTTEHQMPNIHYLGLKPYRELANYAKLFDVAIIPFLVNDMMNCVSPIKFFEYASLGKPVVTSWMKEMEPFMSFSVFQARNHDEFNFYLQRALEPAAVEHAQIDGPALARNNTWSIRVASLLPHLANSAVMNRLLNAPYRKYDVIFLSIIDYDFRYQRPQQIADFYAKAGHRTFYFNPNFGTHTSVTEVAQKPGLSIVKLENLAGATVHLTDLSAVGEQLHRQLDRFIATQSIEDCVVIVEYPNWVHLASYLKQHYGFPVVTDYLDDFGGFENAEGALVVANTPALMRLSDRIVASSLYLLDQASGYRNDVKLVRNGTEFAHFHQAYVAQAPKRERPVIGYYGAMAHWFDVEKICYLSRHIPEADIVLIGDVTSNRERLSKLPNVKLLGEKPYATLPEYLRDFDVCLIPFDTTTNLIKATNPVKFYEYLSAGKKVVATEIPELEEFRDRFVYLTNDNEQFCHYVRQCLNGSDTLASPEEAIRFARQNSWSERVQAIKETAEEAFPLFSVVVLTFNQLEYTKLCVESILNKTAYPRYELIVVDNASSDATPQYLRELAAAHPERVKIILNQENLGFAKGNNVGIRAAQGDYIVLLNNDTIVTRGWLTGFWNHFRKNARLGLVGPVTNSIGNEAKIKVSYEKRQDLERFAHDYTHAHKSEGNPDIRALAMFCLAISREVIEKVGLIEECYGIGMFEDDDYCLKVQQAGFTQLCAEDIFIHHFLSVSFKDLDAKVNSDLFLRNKALFEKRWKCQWEKHLFRPGITWNTNSNCLAE